MDNLNAVVEAVLFASGEALEVEKISKSLLVSKEEILNSLDYLQKLYQDDSHGIMIVNLNGKYQMISKSKFAPEIRNVLSLKNNTPLSTAAFEVLAVIAYNQPVTKSFIEQVRGVDCSGVISTLCQKNLIEECGRLDLPGRPLLYCTTTDFLRCFGISSLDELPKVPEKEIDDNSDKKNDNELEGQMSLM